MKSSLKLFSHSLRQPFKVPSSPSMPIVQPSIENKLNDVLKPTYLDIRNDSALHAHHHAMVIQGGGNGETR